MSDDSTPPWERPATYACGHAISMHYPKRRTCMTCEGKRNRDQIERLAELIRECKRILAGGTDPETERLLIHRLNALGHPDGKELVQFLNEKRERANESPRRRGS